MTLRLPSRKTLALTLAGMIIACLLLSWQVMPWVLHSQLEKFIAQRTGHHLAMNRAEFNPFSLRLRLSDLHLTQPGGEALLDLSELIIDLSATSLYRRAWIFDDIRIDGLAAKTSLLSNRKLNWSGLLDPFTTPSPAQNSTLPKFNIHHFILANSQLDFADQSVNPGYLTHIEPVDVELTELSSLPGNNGQYRLFAKTTSGANLSWQGGTHLEPWSMTGNFSIDKINLAELSPYLKGKLPFNPAGGVVSFSANYRLDTSKGQLQFNLDQIHAKVNKLVLEQKSLPIVTIASIESTQGRFDLTKNTLSIDALKVTNSQLHLETNKPPLKIEQFIVDDINLKLNTKQASIGRISLSGGSLNLSRDKQGRFDILEAIKKISYTEGAKPEHSSASWHYKIKTLALTDFAATIKDETVTPAAQLSLQDLSLSIEGLSEDLTTTIPVTTACQISEGGRFNATGHITPGLPRIDMQLKLTELNLKPVQPYLSTLAPLKLLNGNLSTEGHASYATPGISFQGSFALNSLLINESATDNLFLSWNSLSSRALTLTSGALNIDELTLDGLDTALIINKDKSTSFKRILTQTEPHRSRASDTSNPSVLATAFIVNIDRLRFRRGEMDFADYSLALPFGTRIHHIEGVMAGLSTRTGAQGQLKIDGQVDDFGIARAAGRIDLMNPADFMDLTVAFRNIDMSRLTPYSATFAGRKIESGKLSLDLEYKIKQHQLLGKNQVVMDKLTLGEHVKSPEATNLPLDLAIAILRDSDGRIDLGLPISGSLDDPHFSYSGLIWKAMSSLLSKVVTAPFRALGALFGSDDKLENIVFAAGDTQLTPPEREKILHLATALKQRPGLALSIQGGYSDEDKLALQDLQLRRIIIEKSGQSLKVDEDPGPLALHQSKIQLALVALFSDTLGSSELASLKAGFRNANPGQLEQNAADKLLGGLSSLWRKPRTLTTQEIAALKGVDFYAVLFDRLLNTIPINDAQLQSLATARANGVFAEFAAAGAPSLRLTIGDAKKVSGEEHTTPVKLTLSKHHASDQ